MQVINLQQLMNDKSYPSDIELIQFDPSPFSLKPFKGFIADKQLVLEVALQLSMRMLGLTMDGLHLVGPTGCGKSTVLRQLLALLNYPVHSVTGYEDLEFSGLVGRLDVIEGSVGYVDGPLKCAYELGHAFLFEEREKAPARVGVAMNTILDGSPLHVEDIGDGYRTERQDGFMMISTGNAASGNDFSGNYVGAQQQDASSEDRYDVIAVDYVPPEVEEKMIVKHLQGAPSFLVESIIQSANICRSIHVESMREKHTDAPDMQFTLPITYRGTERILRNTLHYRPHISDGEKLIERVLDTSLNLRSVMTEEAAAIKEIFKSTLLQGGKI